MSDDIGARVVSAVITALLQPERCGHVAVVGGGALVRCAAAREHDGDHVYRRRARGRR